MPTADTRAALELYEEARRKIQALPWSGQEAALVEADQEAAIAWAWVPKEERERPVRMFVWEFESLGEYSTSIPTGTRVGKKWRRDQQQTCRERIPEDRRWFLGEYVPYPIDGEIGIRWQRIVLLEGPRHAGLQARTP